MQSDHRRLTEVYELATGKLTQHDISTNSVAKTIDRCYNLLFIYTDAHMV